MRSAAGGGAAGGGETKPTSPRAVSRPGAPHWDVLVDNGERPGAFDFEGYLEKLTDWGHSCVRMWAHEAWVHELSHSPWSRTGPGIAADGRPRYDLERFDGEYFARLRESTNNAGERGLHAIVLPFNGWSLRDHGPRNPWPDRKRGG